MPKEPYLQPGREGKKALTVYVSEDLRHSVKQLALDSRTTVQDMLEGVLEDLVKSRKKPKPKN